MYLKTIERIKLVGVFMKFVIVLGLLFSLSNVFAADQNLVTVALDKVRTAQDSLRTAQFELAAAQSLLAEALSPAQDKPKTCRVATYYNTYEAAGINESVAISNAKLKCKQSGTIPSVCDQAQLDVCW